MSFLQTLETDVKIVGKEILALAPIAIAGYSLVNPVGGAAISGLYGKLMTAIFGAEQIYHDAKSGATKKQAVQDEFMNALGLAEDITGKKFSVDQDALSGFIDAQVAALNAMMNLKQNVKVA